MQERHRVNIDAYEKSVRYTAHTISQKTDKSERISACVIYSGIRCNWALMKVRLSL